MKVKLTHRSITDDLARDGYAILRAHRADDAPEVAAAVRELVASAPLGGNDFVGTKTRRVYSVFGRTAALDDWAIDPVVLDVVADQLGDALLSSSVLCEIQPGETAQAPHTDDGIYPLPPKFPEVSLSALWAVDDFTTDNGATVVYPGSHGQRSAEPSRSDGVAVEMEAGSVMLYTGTLWHGGGANTATTSRLGLILTYVQSWLRPQDAHLLSVPLEAARGRAPKLRELLGYSVRPPLLGAVDGRDPAELFDS